MNASHQGRIFKLTGGHPALDLVNTLDWRFRDRAPDELLESYGDLLAFAEQTGLLTAKQARRLGRDTTLAASERVLRECRDLREALAELFYAQLDGREPEPAAMETAERYCKTMRERQRLVKGEERFAWELAGADDDPESPLWLLARAAADLLVSDDFKKLRGCGDPECRWLFLDTSKNHTRRWCDMAVCGNRMKARRFKASQRE